MEQAAKARNDAKAQGQALQEKFTVSAVESLPSPFSVSRKAATKKMHMISRLWNGTIGIRYSLETCRYS